MTDAAHPDEVERLMIALWGPASVTPGEAATHAEACDSCAEDVDFHRRLRDAMRRLAAAELAPRLREIARTWAEAEAGAEAAANGPDGAWVQALALPALSGVRSASAEELLFLCDVRGFRVNVVLHPAGRAGRFTLSGQALRDDSSPAAGAGVTLYVGREATATTTTDSFGEFAFGAHTGSRFGLAICLGDERALVEILPGAGAA